MIAKLSILIVAYAMIGCKKPRSSETIEADHELKIVRKGNTLVTASTYVSDKGDGNSVKVFLPGGEWVQVNVVASGDSPSIYIQRNRANGSQVIFEHQPAGTTINRSEHPFGTLPEDSDYNSNSTSQPAATSGGNKPTN